MASAEQVERLEDRIDRLRGERNMAVQERQGLEAILDRVVSVLPKSVTPNVHTGLAAGSGVVLAVINELVPVLPEPVAPAALFVGGIAGQFMASKPDAVESARAATNAGAAITSYIVTRSATRAALDYARSM